MPKPYNGHRSWNSWNICLWIYNDEPLYRYARDLVVNHGVKKAVKIMTEDFKGSRTPDGGVYNRLSIKLALEHIE